MSGFKKIIQASVRLGTRLLDCLMPPYEHIRELESMSADTFTRITARESVSLAPFYPPFRDIMALFPYRTRLVKAAVVAIKSSQNRTIIRLLAAASYEKILSVALSFDRPPFLVPVPMTKRARRARGWNQCEELCKELSILAGHDAQPAPFIYMRDAILRIRDGTDQVGAGKTERAENVAGAFMPRTRKDGLYPLAGQTVIILDDVVTTGATLQEIRNAAYAGGARHVVCVSIAY